MKSAGVVNVVLLGLLLAGCASIISGKEQTLTFNANVNGAEVYLNDQLLGTTPLTVSVKRGQEGTFRVTAEGHQPYEIAVNKKVNGVFFVNILSGGAFGSSTDYSTGAMYAYEPSTHFISLQPNGMSSIELDDWQRREGLRGFVLLNGQALASDLAAGEGEYIDVLVDVLEMKLEDRAAAIERWRADYVASKTAVEFAETMVAQLN
jgi:hypothetical protein